MIEADFDRFYQSNPLALTWREFRVRLAGLPPESMFLQAMHEEHHAWRSALSKVTGRDYAPGERVPLDAVAKGF